jgi:hypothetical protein
MININKYIFKHFENIRSKNEYEKLFKILFDKPILSIKYLPFQYNWVILPDYDIVTQALIKLSCIKIQLNKTELYDGNSIIIKDYIIYIFDLLKSGLISYGCKYPPYKLHSLIDNITVFELAKQVMSLNKNYTIPNDDIFQIELENF